MEAYLDVGNIWEAIKEDYKISPLPNNPTMAQIRIHKERKQQKSMAKSYLFFVVS